MPTFRLTTFRASPGNAPALLAFLRDQVRPLILAAPGNLACQLLQSTTDPALLTVLETWDSPDSHAAAAKSIPPTMLATVMPLLADKPQGAYLTDVSTS